MTPHRGTFRFILMIVAIVGICHASTAGEPHLAASLINGTLQTEKPGTIWIEIKNDANASEAGLVELGNRLPPLFEESLEINASDAIGISAELMSKDSQIRMLSGPQLAGSLGTGDTRTLEFNALAKEFAEPGVYPMDLNLACQRLSNITISGDPEQPDISFQYQNVTESVPVNINVISGPRISVENYGESFLPGEESAHNIVFSNKGDISAEDIHVKVLNGTPFRSGDGFKAIGTLEPGASTSAKFGIKTENETALGEYALQFDVIYQQGGVLQNEEVATISAVGMPSELNSMMLPVAGLLIIALGALLGSKMSSKPFRNRQKKKW